MNPPDKPVQWIMWAAGILLVFVVSNLSWPTKQDEASAVTKAMFERMDTIIRTQNVMQVEHRDLLKSAMIQCYNHAENVPERDKRDRQIRRCITRQLNPD